MAINSKIGSNGVHGSGQLDVSDADYRVRCHIEFTGGQSLPIEYAAPFTLKFNPGTEPYMLQLHMSDTDSLPKARGGNGTPVKFIFSTPDGEGGRADVTIGGWYLVRVEASKVESGLRLVTIADARWKLGYTRWTVSYNIRWPDGSYRDSTVPGGAGRTGGVWTLKGALTDFLTRAGYPPDFSGYTGERGNSKLPDNLGNSKGGGWVDATWEEIVEPMLEWMDANIYFINGKVYITDRSGDANRVIEKIRQVPRIVDAVAPAINDWEKPRNLVVGFEVKAEAAIENFYEPSATTTGGQSSFFDAPENVMPRLTPALRDFQEWWKDQIGEVQDSEWDSIESVVAGLSFFPNWIRSEIDTNIGKNWLLPFPLPFLRYYQNGPIEEDPDPTTNAEAIEKKLWINSQLRRCWHRTYRVKYPTGAVSEMASGYRAMTGLRFGRLTPGGDTFSRGSVWADWCEETTAAVRLAPDPFDTQFGRNHPFDPTRPAPFVADWVAESGNELIFELVPTGTMMLGQEKILPGLYVEVPNYGSWFKMTADDYLAAQDLQATLDADWKFRTVLSGRVIANIDEVFSAASPYGELKGRRLEVTVPLFPQGGIESMEVKESNLTANFGFSADQLATATTLMETWPSLLLNESDLKGKVATLASYWRGRFEAKEAGGMLLPGVSAFAKSIFPAGDVHEMAITVGDPDPWSVTMQYLVIPGFPGPYIKPEDRDGVTPQIVAWE